MKSLAIDIGAESGRVIEGSWADGKLELRQLHRFPNLPVEVDGSLRWNIEGLERDIREGISRATGAIASVGIDTWGVDFVLLGPKGAPVSLPFHYRDKRTDGVMERAFEVVPREEIYEETGIQFLPFNSLYQLYSMALSGDEDLREAERFLTIPDYLTYRLSGSLKNARCEFTNATTTQCYDPRKSRWAADLLSRLDIPTAIFPEVVQPGTIVGRLDNGEAKLIAPACHDTGSAVAAIPAEGEDFAYISSGTWSVMGIETKAPIITPESCAASFTNEGGVGGTFRFCKNVMGLWILQQCRAQWAREGFDIPYQELARLAEAAVPSEYPFDPDDNRFLKPGDMPARIKTWMIERGYQRPATIGGMARLILESLAAKYATVLTHLERLSGRRITRIHVIGGGSQNALLNRLTSEACGVPVIAGPVEATAIGNLLTQFVALGEFSSIDNGRKALHQCTICLPQ